MCIVFRLTRERVAKTTFAYSPSTLYVSACVYARVCVCQCACVALRPLGRSALCAAKRAHLLSSQPGRQSVSPASHQSIRRSNSDDATAGGGALLLLLLLLLPMQTSFARIKGHRLVDIRLDSGQFVRTLVA